MEGNFADFDTKNDLKCLSFLCWCHFCPNTSFILPPALKNFGKFSTEHRCLNFACISESKGDFGVSPTFFKGKGVSQ